MNREIKFRGKPIEGELPSGEKLHGGFVYGSLLQGNGLCQILVPVEGAFKNYKVDPKTVGQFTGLRDRNGEDIYEGDILYIGRSEKGKPVAYSNEYAAFGIQYSDRDFFPFAHDLRDISETCYEVIGNIHDNPELMKGGAQ